MRLRSVLRFSWKNLWTHRLRTILTVGGVTIGIAAIVFLVSLGFGLEQLVTSQVANFKAFGIIDIPSASLKSGKIDALALDKIRAIGHVTQVERVVDLAGRVRLTDQNSTTETVVVGAPPAYFDLADITIEPGQSYPEDSTDQALASRALVNLLGFEQNPDGILKQPLVLDLIIPETSRADDDVNGPLVKEGLTLTIVGITPETGSPTLSIPYALAEREGIINATSMKIRIDDRDAVPTIRQQIENLGFFTEYIGDTVNQITQVFGVFRIVLGSFGIIALIVAAIGTFNTLTISLMERIREVSLLKMLGMQRTDVFKLFIAESLTIGILGGVLGSGFGYGVAEGANRLVSFLAARASADPVRIFETPVSFLIIMGVGSVVVGFLTGIYPTIRAIRTNPLDALRYE